MKRTGPTNPNLQGLIQTLRKASHSQEAPIWKRVAEELARSTRSRRVVNLSRINRYSKENEVVLVPGKVLGSGMLNHKVTIAAYAFSDGAIEQIQQANGQAMSIQELLDKNPKAKAVRILG